MKYANAFGNALHFTPNVIDFHTTTYGDGDIFGGANKIYFFNDISKFIVDDLFLITNEANLLASYGSDLIGTVTNFGIKYTYNAGKKERLALQNPIDAIPFNNLIDGIISWAAVRVKTDGTNDFFIFTDNIGTFYDKTKFIKVDHLVCTIGKQNLMTGISFRIRDKSFSEIYNENLGV